MGANYSRTWVTNYPTGKTSIDRVQLGAEGRPEDRIIITNVNGEQGAVTTDVTRVDPNTWTGTISTKPYWFRVFGVGSTAVTYPTIQSKISEMKNNQDMINLLKESPEWMKEDKKACAIDYFKAHKPSKSELVELKQILGPTNYGDLTAAIVEGN